MYDWITKIFNSKPNEIVELSEEEKKRSTDDYVTQALIFSSANRALNPGQAGSTDCLISGSKPSKAYILVIP
ncbi:MAG: hypothetical protein NT035_05890, partial [Burkholderiales bacterium]|nr:hypothetical protein [Burkholderiales bacterium]